MTKTMVCIYALLILFVVMFCLGFVLTPWMSFLSFVPLCVSAIILFYSRYIKK